MPKVKLDTAFCLTARCELGKKRTDYYDTNITGFVLECRSTGGKTFILRYANAYGKQCQRKIGVYGDISFNQAKRMAKQWRAEVVMGEDVAAKKTQKRSVPTYAELAQQHLEYNQTFQKVPANTERVIRCHLLPQWGKKRLDEITPQGIASWLAQQRKSYAPATVEKMRVTLNRSFELAAKWGMEGLSGNPVQSVPKPKFNNKRERFLTAEEASRLIAACETSTNVQLAPIVRLLLLTGARKMELLRAKWEHIHLDRKAWYLPDTKTGVPRFVPLSNDALEVIQGLPRFTDCPWLVPNPDTLLPYTDIKRAWSIARQKASLKDLHIHDLRHSFCSFAVAAGVDLFTVGKIVGHADYQSTMRYSHLANDALLSAVEAGAAKMRAA